MKSLTRTQYGGTLGAALLIASHANAFTPENPIEAPIAKGNIAIELETFASGLASPNFLTHAGDDSNRLFVVEQPGQIRIVENGAVLPTPFLDVSTSQDFPQLGLFGLDFDERGLLGLAFHPDFANNGKLYTFMSENINAPADFGQAPVDRLTHQSVVTEWQVDNANQNLVDPTTRRDLLRIDNPQFNHNGGAINFGHDGNLYIAVGDGGAANDDAPGHGADGNGQNPTNVLGTFLHIDVDGSTSANGQYGIPDNAPFADPTADPSDTIPDEIFAYGFRNPYRFSFDSETGELITGDVGQGAIEEIDIVTAGGNFGWRLKEGSFAFDHTTGAVSDDLSGLPGGLIDPVAEYDHDEGISVIGGFVYRGSAIPELFGKYIFGDFSTAFGTPLGRLFYADLDTGLINEFMIGLGDRALGLFVKGIGQDADGEIYVLADAGLGANSLEGVALKLVAAPVPIPAAIWLFAPMLGFLARRRYC